MATIKLTENDIKHLSQYLKIGLAVFTLGSVYFLLKDPNLFLLWIISLIAILFGGVYLFLKAVKIN